MRMVGRIILVGLWLLCVGALCYEFIKNIYEIKPVATSYDTPNYGGGWDMYEAQAGVMCKRGCNSNGYEVKESSLEGTVFKCICGDKLDTETVS